MNAGEEPGNRGTGTDRLTGVPANRITPGSPASRLTGSPVPPSFSYIYALNYNKQDDTVTRPMKRTKFSVMAFATALAILMMLTPAFGAPSRPAPQGAGPGSVSGQPAAPAGYIHRPSIEFFTGLSCPSCMAGPHPDMERLFEENGYRPQQDFTYVAFHELNGRGVDDLNTQDATDRMRYYQPGISGTPDSEFDGGYVELGGMTGGTLNYDTAKSAVQTCKDRINTKINPLHPIQSLRNGFKFVKLDVRQMFDGAGSFSVMVTAKYLGTSAFVDTKSLNGQLYVFMVEDNVTAYSKVEDRNVLNHNVFRGFAFKGEAVALKSGESKNLNTNWDIPASTDPKWIPIKPQDVSAVAVVYDLDDTSSQTGTQGNPNRVSRAVQSATPLSTAFDNRLSAPGVGAVKLERSGDRVKLSATFDAPRGVACAYALFNTEAANATNWTAATFNLTGTECEGDTCAVFENATGTVSFKAAGDRQLYVTLLMYDGNMTQGKADLNNITAHSAVIKADVSIPGWAVGGLLGGVLAVGVIYLWKKGKLPIGKKQQAA